MTDENDKCVELEPMDRYIVTQLVRDIIVNLATPLNPYFRAMFDYFKAHVSYKQLLPSRLSIMLLAVSVIITVNSVNVFPAFSKFFMNLAIALIIIIVGVDAAIIIRDKLIINAALRAMFDKFDSEHILIPMKIVLSMAKAIFEKYNKDKLCPHDKKLLELVEGVKIGLLLDPKQYKKIQQLLETSKNT